MESALVRKDAVMLHEPTRTQARATVVGAILAAVCVLGFMIYGFLSPAGAPPKDGGIVISKQSGAVYVMLTNPKMLVATPNMASARLLLMAMGGQVQQDGPTTVDESSLTGVSRGAFTGIPGAPELLPTQDQRVSPDWGVCDSLTLDQSDNQPELNPDVLTTAFGGVTDLGRKLNPNEGLLLKDATGNVHLVYANPGSQGLAGHGFVRAKLDMKNQAVLDALRIGDTVPRKVSTSLLNAIQEVKPIKAPDVTGKGETPRYSMGGNKIGSVVRYENADSGYSYFLLLSDGVQEIPSAVAALMRQSNSSSTDWPAVQPSLVTQAGKSQNPVDIKDFPTAIPKIVPVATATTTCLSWTLKDNKQITSIGVATATPTPNKDLKPVQLAQADGNGEAVDQFFMPPGKAAVVRSSTGDNNLNGPIYLVSDRGVKFSVPSVEVAKGLGLGEQFPLAPETILTTLPSGPALDPKDAARMFDTVEISGGPAVRRPGPTTGAQAGG
ncbi:type VII secretion protein EccB [Crossiella equi]|uniref:Type VII secretion protein EccB n=2 Tax=Crossiella equi TaxID=130796 RepID=A0ABS5AHX5_9PSEU|nr:type VII secretion protein EccB [Crossiella equi]